MSWIDETYPHMTGKERQWYHDAHGGCDGMDAVGAVNGLADALENAREQLHKCDGMANEINLQAEENRRLIARVKALENEVEHAWTQERHTAEEMERSANADRRRASKAILLLDHGAKLRRIIQEGGPDAYLTKWYRMPEHWRAVDEFLSNTWREEGDKP